MNGGHAQLAPELAAFVRGMPVAAVITDLAGSPLEWNRRASMLLRWTSFADAEGELPSFIQGEPRWFQRLRAEALTGEGPAAALLSSRNGARYMRVAAGTVLDPRGGSACLLFTLTDVTRRRTLQRQIRDGERRFEDLVHHSPEPISIQQHERVVYVNPATLRLLGATHEDELIGHSIYDFVHPSWRELVRERARQLSAGSQQTGTHEDRLLRVDGQVIDAEVAAFPILHRGAPAILAIARDVTERKRIEASLRASKERFRLLTEGVRDHAIMMLDPDGKIVSWNVGAERITGYPAHHAVRKHISEVLPMADDGADDTGDNLRMAARDGRYERECWRLRRDGTRFCAHVVVTALFDPDRNIVGFAKIVRDLTERRETEDALRRSEEHLRQAQKMEAVGRLAGGIAHDFNNLLTAIQGHAQFLLEDLRDSETAYADALEIKRAADRAAALTRQLLVFSRKQVLQPLLMNVNLVVRDLHTLLRRVIREDIALETQLADDLWNIRADTSQVEQVLMNLAVNARDAMPRGGTLAVRTRNLELHEDTDLAGVTVPPGRYVQIVVSDTGIGMDRETQARIFEPFFTTKPEGEGTGLGLAIVYGIVRQNGGAISVYSEPGKGTTFRIVFPIATDEEGARRAPQPVPQELARGWESVLVVEDDPGIRTLTSRALQGRGYSVLEAENGKEALRLAEEYDGPIDLVITDIVMPEMSGRRLAESMHAMHPSARVLFMSGFTPDEVVRQGLVDPDAKFIEKPFSPDRLARKVREVLDEG